MKRRLDLLSKFPIEDIREWEKLGIFKVKGEKTMEMITDRELPQLGISTCKDCAYARYGCVFKAKYTEFVRKNLVEKTNDIPSNMNIAVTCSCKHQGELPKYIQKILSLVGREKLGEVDENSYFAEPPTDWSESSTY